MKKFIIWTIVIIGVIAIFGWIGFNWLIQSAFGPITTEGTIEIGHGRSLKYSETYNADLADWWYDVTFYPKNDTSFFESFKNEKWQEHASLNVYDSLTKLIIPDPPRIYIATFNLQGQLIEETSISLDSIH